MKLRHTLLPLSALLAFFAACSTAGNTVDPFPPGAAGAGGGGAAGSAAGGSAPGGTAGAPGGGSAGQPPDGGLDIDVPDTPPKQDLLIYAHTDQTLYQINPNNLGAEMVNLGPFECVGDTSQGQDNAMTDLAVSRDQVLWGVSQSAIYKLDLKDKKVACTETIKLQTEGGAEVRFYGLTFAPVGTLDPKNEVLVAGNTAGELWSIDDKGALKLLGHFGDVPSDDGNGNSYANKGKRWELSGDIVFVEGKGEALGFATVRDCPNPPSTSGCNTVNSLIEIDMKKLGNGGAVTKSVRGQIVKRDKCADKLGGDYGNMYGISAWNDRVFGFSRDGHLVDISLVDGASCLVRTFDTIGFSGAGVTTIAPVEPPPIK